MKIGVFDSGIGGITVLNEIHRQFPGQDFYYFGDSANVPYGTKSTSQIKSLCTHAAARISPFNLDLLIVACNTASSLALTEISKELSPTPVVDVVTAGLNTIRNNISDNLPVLIFGTRATVNSHTYKKRIAIEFSGIDVFEQACPLLVPMIEDGWTQHPILRLTVREYVKPFMDKSGIALLACTHYPWVRNVFEDELSNFKIMDSAQAVAQLLERQFKNKLTSPGKSTFTWHFSDVESVATFPFTSIFGKMPVLQFF